MFVFGVIAFTRELQSVLEYTLWQNFSKVIKRAIIVCKESNYKINDHFIDVNKMIELAKGAKRKGLHYREDILDNMGSEELAANIFRITQTEEKLKNDNIRAKENTNKLITIWVEILEHL